MVRIPNLQPEICHGDCCMDADSIRCDAGGYLDIVSIIDSPIPTPTRTLSFLDTSSRNLFDCSFRLSY